MNRINRSRSNGPLKFRIVATLLFATGERGGQADGVRDIHRRRIPTRRACSLTLCFPSAAGKGFGAGVAFRTGLTRRRIPSRVLKLRLVTDGLASAEDLVEHCGVALELIQNFRP